MADDLKGAVDVSIVSHGHGAMVCRLVEQLLALPEISKVIVTLNIAESLALPQDARLQVIENPIPKGFGANHNAAFGYCEAPYFCVLNPDVELIGNPFPVLCRQRKEHNAGLCAPLIVGSDGAVEDSAREFITPWRILLRKLGFAPNHPMPQIGSPATTPDWVAGMFMLFDANTYRHLNGFDTVYFMYCEDADICTRLWQAGGRVVLCPDVQAIHRAQRASRRSLRHLRWHLASMIRYVARYWGRLPRKPRQL